MDNKQFVAELKKIRPSSTFLTLKGYQSKSGEVADYSIVFHINYKNALISSINTLNSFVPNNEIEEQAKQDCLDSFNKSIQNIESIQIENIQDGYSRFFDENNQYIKGIKLHNKTNTLHLYGFVVHKKIIKQGNFKKSNSSPLTIAKNKLRNMCKVSKFRQFRIIPDQLDSISVEGLHLLSEEL